MLHGAGIFTNICPKNHPVLQVNIPYMEHLGNGEGIWLGSKLIELESARL